MKIALGSDHRGFTVKQRLIIAIGQLGHEVVDLGVTSPDTNVDYPDFAFEVGKIVGEHHADRGILICGTGIGMCIAANKVPGVRGCTVPR